MSISVFFSTLFDFIAFRTVHSRYHLQWLVHSENNCRRVFLEIRYKYQQRYIMLSQLRLHLKYLFLRMLTESQEPLWYQVQQLGEHRSQPSITIIIKSLFQVIDSKITKSSVHFSMSSFKKILLIFHPTCWIQLHY